MTPINTTSIDGFVIVETSSGEIIVRDVPAREYNDLPNILLDLGFVRAAYYPYADQSDDYEFPY